MITSPQVEIKQDSTDVTMTREDKGTQGHLIIQGFFPKDSDTKHTHTIKTTILKYS